jgi:hypothetical protein
MSSTITDELATIDGIVILNLVESCISEFSEPLRKFGGFMLCGRMSMVA